MKEIWRDKKYYEGRYQVSNCGRVKSLKRKNVLKEKILKPYVDKDGYLTVALNNPRKTFLVHRLVAEAFIPNPDNLPCVNHKDENKQNNVVSNLEWCDRKYNQNYGTRTEKCSKKVYQYTLDGELVREWISATEAGRNGFSQSGINNCCLGKAKTHKGFRWSYKKEGE